MAAWDTSNALLMERWQSLDKGPAVAEDRPHASWEALAES